MIQSSPVTADAPYPPSPTGRRRPPSRRQALARHGIPLLAAALIAFAAGIAVGARHEPPEVQAAERYAKAWAVGDWATMHGMLSHEARERISLAEFRRAHERAAVTATATRYEPGRASRLSGDVVRIPMSVATRVFGRVRASLDLPFAEDDGLARVAWRDELAFPGVRRGEELSRTTTLPPRATLLAADGTVIARGPDRSSEAPDLKASIGGATGPAPPERAEELRAKGVPPGAPVGLTGLERALDDELRGRPGGRLLAGDRPLAVAVPRRAAAVRSSIAPSIQRAVVTALAGRIGGVVAMDPRTGRIQGAAGIGLSGLQPPGSTFKIVTLAAALRHGLVSTKDTFPVETHTTLEGVRLENANGESCGGSLIQAFAHSCNSVFAPLGAKVGARRLVRAAEDFGFNAPTGIDGAATSTIPAPRAIGDDLAVGSSAIGQGRVQSTALQMAIISATIANRGRRPVPTLLAEARPRFIRAIQARTARTIARGMRTVVESGTGRAASISGVTVAGKTGTAELRTTVGPTVLPGEPAVPPDPTDTDAWFAAYAPARNARVAVGVMLVEAGAGGEVAAPAARGVLAAALRRRG